MASLTPGILLKLLKNVDDKEAKVVGEHRSALLQVVGIVPSLDDDPWKSRGFYLRVSDSLHSAYVSVLDEDVDLILNDEIQLGQFIHIARLDAGFPVPVLQGLKPVPKRRPCIGEPKDLISSDFLTVRKVVDSKKGRKNVGLDKKVEIKENPKGKVRKSNESEISNIRRLSLSNGKVEALETRRMSLDSTRKGWDRSPGTKNGTEVVSKSKLKGGSLVLDSVLSSKKNSTEDNSASKHPTISPLKSKNVIPSPKSLSKPPNKDLKSSTCDAIPAQLKKVGLSFGNWSDSKIIWNSLPPAVSNLGKEVRMYRNASFLSAVRAMEEASASEAVIRCMSMFADLCESSQKESTGPVLEQFLNLHENMKNAAKDIDALIESRNLAAKNNNSLSSQKPLPEICGNFTNKNALSWVQAAVETDLSRFSLLRKEGKGVENGEKCLYVMIEKAAKGKEADNTQSKNKRSPRNPVKVISKSNAKVVPSSSKHHLSMRKGKRCETEELFEGSGLKDAASLAGKLLNLSHGWFLNYLENFLSKGFQQTGGNMNPETAAILAQIKRVSKWLDDSFSQGSGANERVDDLRKKLYAFLLDHLDSSIGSEK